MDMVKKKLKNSFACLIAARDLDHTSAESTDDPNPIHDHYRMKADEFLD